MNTSNINNIFDIFHSLFKNIRYLLLLSLYYPFFVSLFHTNKYNYELKINHINIVGLFNFRHNQSSALQKSRRKKKKRECNGFRMPN